MKSMVLSILLTIVAVKAEDSLAYLQRLQAKELNAAYSKAEKESDTRLYIIRHLKKAAGGSADESETRAILKKGLSDSNPAVVKETIEQIGKLKVKLLEDSLISFYKTIDKRCVGAEQTLYETRLIQSMGRLGGEKVRQIYKENLEDAIICNRTEETIQAIGYARDKQMIPDLEAFISKIEFRLQGVEATPENSIRFSHHRQTLDLAYRVLFILKGK